MELEWLFPMVPSDVFSFSRVYCVRFDSAEKKQQEDIFHWTNQREGAKIMPSNFESKSCVELRFDFQSHMLI